MENGTQGKNVALGLDVISLQNGGDFRGNIARGSASIEDVVFWVSIRCKPEINDNWIKAAFSPEHDVLGLDISMHDSIIVHFLQSKSHSLDKLSNLARLEHGFFLIDAIVEVTIGQ